MTEPRIIRKYPNRRLYDTTTAQFINTDALRDMVIAGDSFRVLDSKTKKDLTRQTLLQVVTEAEEKGEPLLSEDVLRHMIRFYGSVMQSAFRPYLERSITQFLGHQEQWQQQLENLFQEGPLGALQDVAKVQGEVVKQWTQMWSKPSHHSGTTTDPEES
jgi:polyhydroxyalkanoate synthesis repressor PhaR